MIKFTLICLTVFLCNGFKPSSKQIEIGKAIDVLHHDIPEILINEPDLSIYSENIDLRDPYGSRFQGKTKYSQVLKIGRIVNNVIFKNLSHIQASFDYDDSNKILSVYMRSQVHFIDRILHANFNSRYYFNDEGKIHAHTIDRYDWNKFPKTHKHEENILVPEKMIPAFAYAIKSKQKKWPKTTVDIYGNVVAPELIGEAKIKNIDDKPENQCQKLKNAFIESINEFTSDSCELDIDCPLSMICCDFIVTKRCCGGNSNAPIPIPIPILVENPTLHK